MQQGLTLLSWWLAVYPFGCIVYSWLWSCLRCCKCGLCVVNWPLQWEG
jgi:hypothetical protein